MTREQLHRAIVGPLSGVTIFEAGLIERAMYNVRATGHVAKLRKDLGLAS